MEQVNNLPTTHQSIIYSSLGQILLGLIGHNSDFGEHDSSSLSMSAKCGVWGQRTS